MGAVAINLGILLKPHFILWPVLGSLFALPDELQVVVTRERYKPNLKRLNYSVNYTVVISDMLFDPK